MKRNLKIINGSLFYPASGRFLPGELNISDGQIVDLLPREPDHIIDAGGCIVTPGLIDFHLHACDITGTGLYSLDGFCCPNGVTTCVDAGTTGYDNARPFLQESARWATRVLALLSTAPGGQMCLPAPENQDPRYLNVDGLRALCREFSDRIVGLKVRQQDILQEPYGLRNEHIEAGVRAAQELGLRLVAHVNDPVNDVQETAALLRPGDVYCHMYAGLRERIVTPQGNIKPGIRAARDRGVIFDACNGRSNFLFDVALPAIRERFLPDIISSDVNVTCYYEQPLTTLPILLSKYLAMGMSLEQVLNCATMAPARWLGKEELADLRPGTPADIAIFRLEDQKSIFRDWQGGTLTGDRLLMPKMTITRGNITYCESLFFQRFVK